MSHSVDFGVLRWYPCRATSDSVINPREILMELTHDNADSIKSLFENIAGLPEITEGELEAGTYTNAQIVEKVPNPIVLTQLILNLPKDGTPASRRSALCKSLDALGSADEQYQRLVEASFKAAGLPEVDEKDLETGTYTNAQIAAKLRKNPVKLVQLLMGLDAMGGDVTTKRSILSFAVDMPD